MNSKKQIITTGRKTEHPLLIERRVGFTQREVDTLAALERGKRPYQIAEDMKLSQNTVNTRLNRLKKKLNVYASYQLAGAAKKEGVL